VVSQWIVERLDDSLAVLRMKALKSS